MVFRYRRSGSEAEEGAIMKKIQSISTFFIVATGSSFHILAASINESADALAQAVATTTPQPSSLPLIEDIVPKSVLTFIGLAIFILIGLVVAKLVDRFHDSVALRDDSSDISEHTRDLLKARFALFAFSPAKIQSEADRKQRDIDRARKFGRLWMARAAMSRRQKRESALNIPSVTIESETPRPTGSAVENVPTTSGSVAATPPIPSTPQPSKMSVSFKPKEATIDENEKEEPGGNKTKRNNEFIAIDIQKLNESTETSKEGSSVPSSPRRSHIEFRDVGEDVTIPVRVVQNERFQSILINSPDNMPPKPKLAYADSGSSEFGSGLSVRQPKSAPPPTVRSHTVEGLEITSLSRENSCESLGKLKQSESTSKVRVKTANKKHIQATSRPITPGARFKDSRSMTPRGTTSRPLTAGRAQPITQGVRGFRVKAGFKSAYRKGR